MLQHFFIPNLKRRRKFSSAYFQQDGAPAHFALMVCEQLNRIFTDKWIARNGPFMWPARCPDLSSLDLFLWVHIKNNVYRQQPENLDDFKDCIEQEFVTVTLEMCQSAMDSFHSRLQLCIDLGGKHVKQ